MTTDKLNTESNAEIERSRVLYSKFDFVLQNIMDEAWIEKYADQMYAYARLRLSDEDEIKDVIQETFLAAVKSFDKFRGDSGENTWLIGILRHKIHDVYRANSRKKKYFADNLESDSEKQKNESMKKSLTDKRAGPVQIFEENSLREQLFNCIEKLPDISKTALRMRELDDLPTSEICNILSIRPTNLNVILFRARVNLKKCLESNGIHGV